MQRAHEQHNAHGPNHTLSGRGDTSRERRHQRILEAAGKLFAEHGFDGVNFDDIALDAQVARRTLYNHFTSKDEIIRTICSPILHEALAVLEVLETRERLSSSEILDLCFDLWERHGTSLRLIHQSAIATDDDLKQLHTSFTSKFVNLFAKAGEDEPLRLPASVTALLVFKTWVRVIEALEYYTREEYGLQRSLFKNIIHDMIVAADSQR